MYDERKYKILFQTQQNNSNFELLLNSKSLPNEYFSTTAALFNLCDVLLYHVLVGTRR